MRWNLAETLRTTVQRPLNSDMTITLVLHQRDELSNALESAVKDAAQKAGYTINSVDSKNSVSLQLAQVKGAKKRGEKAIIINLVNPIDPSDILEAAKDMKVVLLNHALTDLNVLNENVVFIGPDDMLAGKIQGEWLSGYFKTRGKNNIQYILLEGIPDWPATINRTKGAIQALTDEGLRAVQVAAPTIANYSREEAEEILIPILRSGIIPDAIIANNDDMALGAVNAMEHIGIDPAKTAIAGINALPAALEAIREGKMVMTVFQNLREQGTASIAALVNMMKGMPINQGTDFLVAENTPYILYVPLEPVTKTYVPSKLKYPLKA